MSSMFPSLQEIQEIQSRALVKTMAYVAAHSPFYKEQFNRTGINPAAIKKPEDLQQLPFTTKEDLQLRSHEFLCVEKRLVIDYSSTSGTLGTPVTVGLTENDLDRLALNEYGSFLIADGSPDDIYQLHLTLDRQFMAGIAYYSGLRKLGAGIIRLGPGLPAMQWENISRYQPTVIVGVPSMLVKLIEYCKQKNLPLEESSVRKAICIGESIRRADFSFNTLGKAITDHWPIRLYSTYAATEMQTAFTECRCGRGGHLQPHLIIAELIGENDLPVADGEPGEVTITTLGVEGMPLLRYKTGDICIRHPEPCACGRNTFRLSPVLGRKKQMIKLRGTTLYPQSFQEILQAMEHVQEYVLEVNTGSLDTDEVVVHLQLDVESNEVIRHIRTELQARLRIIPDVRIHSADSIRLLQYPDGSRKIQRFIDHRKPHKG
ncbi:MAG: AMP-binding protein [Bacteroidia bacterium]